MQPLTDLQREFVHYLVTTGCTPTEAARTAGYAEPKQEAYRLTRLAHIQAAIREERERLISSHGANLAMATLCEIMRDRGMSPSARVSASRAVLEAAGIFDRNGRDSVSGKALHELSTDELTMTLARLDEQVARFAPGSQLN